jgi:hypothetical protein
MVTNIEKVMKREFQVYTDILVENLILGNELSRYDLDSVGVLEIRWDSGDTE